MVRIVELIERDYREALDAGRLCEWGAMPLLDSEKLVVVARDRLALYMAHLDRVEHELCKRTVDETLDQLEAQERTNGSPLSPSDIEDEEASHGERRSRGRRKRHGEGRPRAPKISFIDMFGGLFANRTNQVG